MCNEPLPPASVGGGADFQLSYRAALPMARLCAVDGGANSRPRTFTGRRLIEHRSD